MQKLERRIAKLYIVLLPMRMLPVFQGVFGVLGGSAIQFDFILHFLGVILFVVQLKKIKMQSDTYKTFFYFCFMVCVFNIISMCNALVHFYSIGTVLGEDTFSATIGQIIYWFQYALIAFYNIRVFQLIDLQKIFWLLQKMSWVLLGIGYIQIGIVLTQQSILIHINDLLAKTGIVLPVSYLLIEQRIPLIASEPAYAGNIIVRLILPIILMNILMTGITATNMLWLLVWIPPIYYTKSTNTYILVATEFIVFFGLLLMQKLHHLKLYHSIKRHTLMVMTAMGASITMGLLFVIQKGMDFRETMYYLIYKLVDTSNMSTVWRTVPILINYRVFLRYPIFGIGNGNQGFFYWEYFPQYAYDLLKDTQTFQLIQTQITNGMLFFPSILSGYGLIGVILFVIFIVMSFRIIYQWRKNSVIRPYCFYYCIAIAGILVGGMVTDFVGNYDAWFVFSIPFCIEGLKKLYESRNVCTN